MGMSSMINPYRVWSTSDNVLGIVYSYDLKSANQYAEEIFGKEFGYVQLLLSVEV
jgi:hypothetical protein